jgi:hypothetical protein
MQTALLPPVCIDFIGNRPGYMRIRLWGALPRIRFFMQIALPVIQPHILPFPFNLIIDFSKVLFAVNYFLKKILANFVIITRGVGRLLHMTETYANINQRPAPIVKFNEISKVFLTMYGSMLRDSF